MRDCARVRRPGPSPGSAVNASKAEAGEVLAGDGAELGDTLSYARVRDNAKVRNEVEKVAAPIERSYHNVIGQLREQKAVGVVVAVNGDIIWADIFASPAL